MHFYVIIITEDGAANRIEYPDFAQADRDFDAFSELEHTMYLQLAEIAKKPIRQYMRNVTATV